MIALAATLFIALVLRLAYQPPEEAVVATLSLLPFMVVAYKLGGWTSFGAAFKWAKQHRLVSNLELIFVCLTIAMNFYGGLHPPLSLVADLIFAYFFLHTFGAIGEWIKDWRARKAWGPGVPASKYSRLASLKRLVDNGTLDTREFEQEKAKVLSEP